MDNGLKTPQMPPLARFRATLAGAYFRLRRRPPDAQEPLWTATMTRWLIAALVTALLAGLADEAAIRAAMGSQAPAVRLMAWITNIGKSQWYLVPAALVFIAVGLYDWSRGGPRAKVRRAFQLGQAAYVFLSVAAAGIAVNVVKVLVGRARPIELEQLGAWHFDFLRFGYDYASFPSGHSATVGAVAGILMVWFPRWSIVIVELGLFFAATRIAALAHYPSDVVTGFTVGVFSAVIVARWLARRGVVFRIAHGRTLPLPYSVLTRKTAA